MKQMITGPSMPTALICINKSRIKVYDKETTPTYYLEKGQEFQIELFNPTSDTILAKIKLNGNQISQGGLVLRPGERVFLERYLDVAKKFKFDIYEVANTSEVRKAIEDNGDFSVEFYKELQPLYHYSGSITLGGNPTYSTGITNISNTTSSLTIGQGFSNNMQTTSFYSHPNNPYDNASIFTDKVRSRKSIETGRVEAGSSSAQKIQTVNKTFDVFPFHSLEYKMLPISQKINTIDDISIKRYCTSCGTKQKPEFKFCPSCGEKC